MADISVRNTLIYKKNNVDYARSASFTVSISGTEDGPAPGAVRVTLAGVNVDLSKFTTPGMCRIENTDGTAANIIDVGIWDPETSTFYPLAEVIPGEAYVLRLSRNLAEESGTGTGTSGPATNTLRLKAQVAACNAVVEAFEA
jgi:hypothetical protein